MRFRQGAKGVGQGDRRRSVSDFVGSGHIALVDMLVDRLADIREGKRCPRVVVLEAESGAGKSRIIREFYE